MLYAEEEHVSGRRGRGASENVLLDAIIEHFVLFGDHWEHPIKGKAILLWSRNGLGVAHQDSLKIVVE